MDEPTDPDEDNGTSVTDAEKAAIIKRLIYEVPTDSDEDDLDDNIHKVASQKVISTGHGSQNISTGDGLILEQLEQMEQVLSTPDLLELCFGPCVSPQTSSGFPLVQMVWLKLISRQAWRLQMPQRSRLVGYAECGDSWRLQPWQVCVLACIWRPVTGPRESATSSPYLEGRLSFLRT